jgi:hypothetical protein
MPVGATTAGYITPTWEKLQNGNPRLIPIVTASGVPSCYGEDVTTNILC